MRGPITQSWTIWNEPRPGDSLDDRCRWVDGPPAGDWASAGVEVVPAEQLRGVVEALREYGGHQSWRCEHPPHWYLANASAVPEGDCPCGWLSTLARFGGQS